MELASTFDPEKSSTQGHYNIGTVYKEYSHSYADLRQTQKALDYLDRAQVTLRQTRFWELLVLTSRAEALIKGGEFREGIQIAVETVEQIRACLNCLHSNEHNRNPEPLLAVCN